MNAQIQRAASECIVKMATMLTCFGRVFMVSCHDEMACQRVCVPGAVHTTHARAREWESELNCWGCGIGDEGGFMCMLVRMSITISGTCPLWNDKQSASTVCACIFRCSHHHHHHRHHRRIASAYAHYALAPFYIVLNTIFVHNLLNNTN